MNRLEFEEIMTPTLYDYGWDTELIDGLIVDNHTIRCNTVNDDVVGEDFLLKLKTSGEIFVNDDNKHIELSNDLYHFINATKREYDITVKVIVSCKKRLIPDN
jgi:hypothetical protein